MARNSRFTSYGERSAGEGDWDESGSDSASYLSDSYHSDQSMLARANLLPDDPIPIFLSASTDEFDEPGLGRVGKSPFISSRMIKAVILAGSAAAIVFTIVSVENPLSLFANAKASLPAATADQASTSPPPAVQSVAAVSPPVAASVPTRDEIAAALRTAHQSQPEIRAPEIRQPPAVVAVAAPAVVEVAAPAVAAPAPAAPPARRLDADELATLLKRAKGLIAIGDIAPARLLLQRAADAQEASAALLLAQTYDPAVLGTPDMRSITPDPAMARAWYQKAAQFGSLDAQQRLAQMQN